MFDLGQEAVKNLLEFFKGIKRLSISRADSDSLSGAPQKHDDALADGAGSVSAKESMTANTRAFKAKCSLFSLTTTSLRLRSLGNFSSVTVLRHSQPSPPSSLAQPRLYFAHSRSLARSWIRPSARRSSASM